MKEISISQGRVAIVDDNFFPLVACTRWASSQVGRTVYAIRKKDGKSIYMHRQVMETFLGRRLNAGEEVDHIDRDGLNNQIANLRLADRSENQRNQRLHRDSKSDYIGVHFNKNYSNPWRVKLMLHGKNIHLNRGFDRPEDAAAQRDLLAIKYFGNYTNLNFEDRRSEYQEMIRNGYDPDPYDRHFSSKYPGISFQAAIKKWKANIYADGKQIYLGVFDTEEEAVEARRAELRSRGMEDNSRIRK